MLNEEVDIAMSIVRTYSAGAFAGYIRKIEGKRVTLQNSRQLWRWHTANNGLGLSEVAVHGLNQEKSKICCRVPERIIDYEEILYCTKEGEESIENAPEYTYNGKDSITTQARGGQGYASAAGDEKGAGEGHGEGCSGYGAGGGLGRGASGAAGFGDGSGLGYSSDDRD